jgi:hypothetical protein
MVSRGRSGSSENGSSVIALWHSTVYCSGCVCIVSKVCGQ